MQRDRERRDLDEILARMVRLVAEIRRRQADIYKTHGVTMLQYTAIHALRRAGPTNITGLAAALHLNQSTVSALVDRMERDGLVRRVQSSRDRRAVKLRLTERADEIADELRVSPYDFFRSLVEALAPGDRRALARIAEKLEGTLFERLERLDRDRPLRTAQKPRRRSLAVPP